MVPDNDNYRPGQALIPAWGRVLMIVAFIAIMAIIHSGLKAAVGELGIWIALFVGALGLFAAHLIDRHDRKSLG